MQRETTIVETAVRLRNQLDSLPAVQPQNFIVGQLQQTANAWDFEGTLGTTLPSSNKQFTVDFVATNQLTPFADIRVVTDPVNPTGGVGTRIRILDNIYFNTTSQIANTKRVSFFVQIENITASPLPIKVKFYIDATDVGTVTIVERS